uniref:hypothetical protein n=1 Tax=Micromonospora tulbaghiae TaxID=479978 RepID=UPI003EBFC3CA
QIPARNQIFLAIELQDNASDTTTLIPSSDVFSTTAQQPDSMLPRVALKAFRPSRHAHPAVATAVVHPRHDFPRDHDKHQDTGKREENPHGRRTG